MSNLSHKIKPLGNRVLIQRNKAPSTKGGILLPDSAQEKPKEGTILAVGPGKVNDKGEREQLHVKVGDRVMFSSYSGTEVNGEEGLLIMSEDDLLGVLS